jgi:hypothetical protein
MVAVKVMVTMDVASMRHVSKLDKPSVQASSQPVQVPAAGMVFVVSRQASNLPADLASPKSAGSPQAAPLSPTPPPPATAVTVTGNNSTIPPSSNVSTAARGYSTAAEKKIRE